MSERTEFERELVRRLADAAPAAAPGALERAILAIANVPQRRGLIRLSSAMGSVPWMRATAAVAVVVAALVVGYALGRLSPRVGDGPSATPFQRVDQDDAWPGELRDEPFPPAGVVPFVGSDRAPLIHRDPSGDVIGAPAGADLTLIHIQATPADGIDAVALQFELAAAREVLDSFAAYGVVVDVDGDGLPDFRIGMDNRDGERHREWISDLSTGRAHINDLDETGHYGMRAFGMFTDTVFPGHELPANEGYITATVGARGVRFYVWASVLDEDGTVYNDYAPNVGWFEFFPNRLCEPGCDDSTAPPAPGG